MSQIKVNSEIGRLKVVLLHEPGEELHNLTPSKLDDLLFDDIPWLPLAKKEHQAFAKTFIDAGVKVVYLVDLMKEVLDLSNDIRNEFIEQFVNEADIHSNTLKEVTLNYLKSIKDNKELVLKTIAGIKKTDIPSYGIRTLTDHVENYLFVTDPIPNLYFQRDPFASIGGGVSLNSMFSVTRSRETIYGEYIFKYHPDLAFPSCVFGRRIAIIHILTVVHQAPSLHTVVECILCSRGGRVEVGHSQAMGKLMTEQSDTIDTLVGRILPGIGITVELGVHAVAVHIFPVNLIGTDNA